MEHFVQEINRKLRIGWNPITEKAAEHSAQSILEGISHYKSTFMPQRPDSVRTYKSVLNMFQQWLVSNGLHKLSCASFTKDHAVQFLAEMMRHKNLKPRTYNNYMNVLRTVFTRLVEQQYAVANPFSEMKKRRTTEKNRQVIPDKLLFEIITYFELKNPNFELICLLIMHCGIRPTEICALTPANIRPDAGVISFHSNQTKNKKSEIVTVPDHLMQRLVAHAKNAHANSFLFAKDNGLNPGKHHLNPRRLAKIWDAMRIKLDIPEEYKLYSLKDTGATKLAYLLQPKELQEQMRHSSLTITQVYLDTARPIANKNIQSIDLIKRIFH